MLDEIAAKRDEIYAIARKHKAEKLWVFGSCARREERPDSALDLLVDFNDGASLFSASKLKTSLASFLGCNVDVVSSRCIEDDSCFAREVKKDMIAI